MGEERRAAARRRGDRGRGPAQRTTVATGQPVVAIVGYPNVGKSTLFNRLTGRSDAVVDSTPGVTRDRKQGGAEWNGRAFQLLDTGGIDEADPTPIGRQVAAQAVRSIDEADLILFVLDATLGATAGDLEVAERLRRAGRPVLVVANKADGDRQEAAAQSLWGLGLGDVVPVSALHGRGTGDLLDAIVARLPDAPPAVPADEAAEGPPAICILGRPNVGKSSILNALLGEERVVVHDRPGTTRDPVDTLIEVDGRDVVLIDTAGLRKRGRMRESVEHYSQIRALRAAERSDVAFVVCDATEGLTDSDLSAVDQATRAHCATVVVMNKWDLAQPELDHIIGRIRAKTRQRPPVEVCSAVTGEGLHRLLPAALRQYERTRARIPTHALNEALRELAEERPGPRKGRKRLSLRYLVQTGTAPPTFRLEVNDMALLTRDYGFWLENRLRRRFDLEGVPLVIVYRERGDAGR
ncbi:MAG: ribosome biogenesis GTPase Der [Actinomycetota bacterium]